MKLHCPTTKILGPPGTGKTTSLLKLLEEEILGRRKAKPDRIIYTSYTRTGVYEARDRACVQFGLVESDFPYFATMHSICMRSIMRIPLLDSKDLLELGKILNTSFTFSARKTEQGGFKTKGDAYQEAFDYFRKTRVSLDFARRLICPNIPLNELEMFAETYNEFKKVKKRADYTDFLTAFLQSPNNVDVDYIICDEVQDFFPLQWQVLQKMSQSAKHVWVGGDDDQCIHAWSGSDPEDLINLEGEEHVLPKSYRLPIEIKTKAQEIITRVRNRIDKDYEAERHTGKITYHQDTNTLAITEQDQGSWLLLARNWQHIGTFSDLCDRKGILYEIVGDSDGNRVYKGATIADLFKGIPIWKKLVDGEQILAKDVKLLYSILKNKDRVKHGYKKIMEEADDYSLFDIKDLTTHYGLLYTKDDWEGAFYGVDPLMLGKLKVAEKNGELDNPEIRVKISSIHSSKGMEADNVVLSYEMSRNTWKSFVIERDNEHRVAYVGVTRAKKHLHILQPKTGQHYKL